MEFTGFEHIKERQWEIPAEEVNAFVESVATVTEEEHTRIKNLPQHDPDGSTNDDWIEARRLRITGSASGAVALQNPYESCENYIDKKINPVPMDARGLAYCKWGNDHEDTCEDAFKERYLKEKMYEFTRNNGDQFLGLKIHHLGLYICKEAGWGMLGMSPDGILESAWKRKEDGTTYSVYELCEWKCPATWEKKRANPEIYKVECLPKTFPRAMQSTMGRLPPTKNGTRYHFPCPSYYFSQVQYGMALFRKSGVHLERAWFGVWCPEKIAVTCVPFDEVYGDWILKRCRDVWMNDFMPRYLKDRKVKEVFPVNEKREDEPMADDVDDLSTVFSGIGSIKRKRE